MDYLGLKVGDSATAIVKAPDVLVGKSPGGPVDGAEAALPSRESASFRRIA